MAWNREKLSAGQKVQWDKDSDFYVQGMAVFGRQTNFLYANFFSKKEAVEYRDFLKGKKASGGFSNTAFTNGQARARQAIANKMQNSGVYQNMGSCSHYRRDTETCATGCPQINVAKSGVCPTDGEESSGTVTCPCYS